MESEVVETAMRLGLLPIASLQDPPSLQDPGGVPEPNGDIDEINMISDSDETLVDSEVYSPPAKKIKIEAEVSMQSQRGDTPSSKSMEQEEEEEEGYFCS